MNNKPIFCCNRCGGNTNNEYGICDECEWEMNYDRHYSYDDEPTRDMILDGEGVHWE